MLTIIVHVVREVNKENKWSSTMNWVLLLVRAYESQRACLGVEYGSL